MASVDSSPSAFLAQFRVILAVALLCLFLARVDAGNVNRSEEVRALLNFRDWNSDSSTASDRGYWLTWKENDTTPCDWGGVTCTTNYTVEELDFSGWGFSISNLAPLNQLRYLRVLDLSSNDVSFFDGEICNSARLTRLDLSRSTGAESNLSFEISTCHNLRILALQESKLIEVPSGIRDLVNLQFLNLADNFLIGPFPIEELGNFSSLISLDLSGNGFNGSIPALPNLSNLVELKLDNNQFSGFEVPWFLGSTILHDLSVANNSLEGMIPSSITNFSNLLVLNMSNNSLSGNIPAGFSTQMNLGISLDLSLNQLSGEMPADMLSQTDWESTGNCASVNVSHNLLSGNIRIGETAPFCFAFLDLSHNNLSGSIPLNFSGDTYPQIHVLRLQHNRLSGDIVDVLVGGILQIKSEFKVEDNLFTGDLSRMADTKAYDMAVSGGVLDLSNNRLTWSVSETFLDPIQATLEAITSGTAIKEFRVGGNNFSGTSLPTSCGGTGLTVLDLSNSHLMGEISSEAFDHACLGALQLLNLSSNDATGSFPANFFAQFDQQFVVDVSNNNLSGHLPLIPPNSFLYNPKYFAGNDGLCGDPLQPCLLPKQGTGVRWWVLLVIIGGSVIIAMGSCLAATWRWKVYQKRHQQDADLIRTLLERDSASLMPLRELKKATDNFSETAQIGEGGFGTVYMGKLNDGTIVAVKRSKREGSEMDKEQYLNEVKILSQVNHRHLVKLLGCCMENKVAVLVFEFVPNGTLHEHLRDKREGSHLSWKQRLNIAAQTADALHYLHSAAAFPIIHRDVKSANILLNEDLDAKVADFGISRLAPLRATHVSTAAIQGTMGYIDPEYYTSYQLTDKSDVYSFGVVLLELISAKPCIDFSRGGDETSLVNMARPYIERGDLEHFIDPFLTETYRDPNKLGRKSILNVGRLAMKCLNMHSKSRPSMKQVLKDLQNLSLKFGGTTENVDLSGEDGHEDTDCENAVLLSNAFSNGFPVTIKTEGGIEMSHSCPSQRFRSRSMA